MMYGYGDWDGWGWIVAGLMMLLFLGGVATVVVLLLRGSHGSSGAGGSRPTGAYYPQGQHDDPERILSQRFARGEIDEAEYKARLDALRRRP